MSREALLAIARIIQAAAGQVADVLEAAAEEPSPAPVSATPAPRPPTKAAVYAVSSRGREAVGGPEGEICTIHNEMLQVGRGKPYCHSCWKEKKQAEGTWEERP